MSDAETRHARSMLLRHRSGVLAWTDIGEDRVELVCFVLDPGGGAIVMPVSNQVVEAESHVLHVPDEGDDALQLLLELDREHAAGEALVDRWRIHHGDPPRRLPGDYKGEPAKAWWARCRVETARLGPSVIDGESLLTPNPLAAIEPRLCRRLNTDRDALKRICAAVAGASPSAPVCVGVDDEGVHIRADGGLLRLDFDSPRTAPSKVEATIEQWLDKSGASA